MCSVYAGVRGYVKKFTSPTSARVNGLLCASMPGTFKVKWGAYRAGLERASQVRRQRQKKRRG